MIRQGLWKTKIQLLIFLKVMNPDINIINPMNTSKHTVSFDWDECTIDQDNGSVVVTFPVNQPEENV